MNKMQPMTRSQQVLYDIATDPDKAENYFVNLGAEKYINRFWMVCFFCLGLVVGIILA